MKLYLGITSHVTPKGTGVFYLGKAVEFCETDPVGLRNKALRGWARMQIAREDRARQVIGIPSIFD